MDKKHIVIIGLGGVGGYFGFKINQTNELNNQYIVSFVARGKTCEVVKKNGLTLLSPEHPNCTTIPDNIYQNISEIPYPDLILVCVKEYDLENVCTRLTEVITSDTIILPLMNGVDIYDRIRKIIPNNVILPSCVYVASHIKEKGIVEHRGKSGKLIVGKDPMNFSADVNWVINLIKNSNINVEFKDDSRGDIWTKFILVASLGLVTAKYNSSIGAVCTDKCQKEEATKIMEEIKWIADRKGIYLHDYIIPKVFEEASSFPSKSPTSLQLDINSGKENNELDLFAGAMIKYGKECGIKTPFTQKIVEEIKEVMGGKVFYYDNHE